MAGINSQHAYVSVSGIHIQSQNSKGVVAVAQPTQEITAEDIDRVIDAAKAVSLPTGKEILHVIPKNFKVDSQDGIKDPIGMSGIRLESEAHIVTASSVALKNIEKCVNEMGIQVDEFVFAGWASAEAVVTETEKELGVLVIDIGAGSTSLCAYVEGSLEFTSVLPVGAQHITRDIALGCKVSIQSAEKIKLMLPQFPEAPAVLQGETKEDARKRLKKQDLIDVSKLGIHENVEFISRKFLVERVMIPRMQEIFKLVGKELDQHHLFEQVPAGVVLTGGGADTVGIDEVCKHTLQLGTRLGHPHSFKGLIDEIEQAKYATVMGLLQYGARKGGENLNASSGKASPFSLAGLQHVPQKLIAFIRSLLP
jgi:cell division protein FtsA